MRSLFDPNPGLRTEDEWRTLLNELVDSLSRYTGVAFTATSWFAQDDRPGYASSSNCVDIRSLVSGPLALQACGVVCISINFGETVRASADLLLFSGGSRILGPTGRELVAFLFSEKGWVNHGWVADEFGEWKFYDTDARWREA